MSRVSLWSGSNGPLTTREREVLRTARGGGSVADVATSIHLAPGTVRNSLWAAMTNLDAPTRHAAAHIAWEQGWI